MIFLGVDIDTFWNQTLAQSAPLPLTRPFNVLFVGKILCLVTIVRIVVLCFLVFVPDGESLGTLFQTKKMGFSPPSLQISIRIF